ncbi:2-phosphoxylose phosphatase 1-like [Watersipora subatra]|uniref:2-phosphoxylose phosphatase 1-like n=1 Tax=Watersipora subatra TaxID=2589382 RepID=UPI00355C970C
MANLRQMLVLILSASFVSVILLVHQLHKLAQPRIPESPGSLYNRVPPSQASSSAIQGYCNHADNITIGAEGLPPNGYKLISVTTLIRHGDRLPMLASPPLGPFMVPRVNCELNVSHSSISHLFNMFIEKTKDMPKTDWPFPLRPVGWCNPEDLTPSGVEQQIKNGLLLREAYGEQLILDQKNIRVVSTTFSRTYQSSIALMFGLLGEGIDFESLHVDSTNNTMLCRSSTKQECYCPRAEVFLLEAKRDLARLRKHDENFHKFNDSIHKTFQQAKIGSVEVEYPWSSAHDMLASRFCSSVGPYCQRGTCITEAQIDLNWGSLNSYHQEMSKNSNARGWAKLAMYHFFQELVQRLTRHATHPASIKDVFSVYAAHDVTIKPLFLALELPLNQWPPYASRVMFELYRPTVDADTEEFLLKIIYNGQDLTRLLKFCTTRIVWSGSGCALRDFINYFRNMLPSVGGDNFGRACRV